MMKTFSFLEHGRYNLEGFQIAPGDYASLEAFLSALQEAAIACQWASESQAKRALKAERPELFTAWQEAHALTVYVVTGPLSFDCVKLLEHDELTPQSARAALRKVGHTVGLVWHEESSTGYRVYANSARRVTEL